ncbi:hypothetical protein DFH11DRAFT_1549631 [Phellopilus nigrolimitatus]|nr:hypothetical protein DFH11DRAFT_1549631 [Phellopilus nigrolimitatus]
MNIWLLCALCFVLCALCVCFCAQFVPPAAKDASIRCHRCRRPARAVLRKPTGSEDEREYTYLPLCGENAKREDPDSGADVDTSENGPESQERGCGRTKTKNQTRKQISPGQAPAWSALASRGKPLQAQAPSSTRLLI